MVNLPDKAEAARETANLLLAQALGIDHDALAALKLGKSLRLSDEGNLGRIETDP